MNVNAAESPRVCTTCGQTQMKIDGAMKCPNCSSGLEPKTGVTVILTEPQGEKGPVVIQRLTTRDQVLLEAEQVLQARKKAVRGGTQTDLVETEEVKAPVAPAGTVTVHVPISLFPDLVMWARKLKLPKDWKEAEKIKAITDFQIEINSKLGGLK